MKGLKARLAFFRGALATRRWSFFKYAWLLLGAYDLILSQLIPKSVGDSFPKTYEALTSAAEYISWQAWAGAGIAILVLASLEYSFRRTAPVKVSAENDSSKEIGALQDHSSRATIANSGTRSPSIAVMPFLNVSGQEDQAFIGDGLTIDIISNLSRIRSFRVIAQNSTFVFKGRSVDPRQIARELNVNYLLEGDFVKSDDRFRVSVRLIDGETGGSLWSQRYDQEYKDLFRLQDDLTESVIARLEPELNRAEFEKGKSKPPESLASWELYQRGLHHLQLHTVEDFEAARRLFKATIDASPDFAPAYAGMAIAYRNHAFQGGLATGYDEALRFGKEGILLDPRDARSRIGLAYAYLGKNEFWAALKLR